MVATPIGNLGDITLRALQTLRDVDTILAEDTRRTRQLCMRHGITTPLESFHSHSTEHKRNKLLEHLHQGRMFALTTDAGTPCLSDPGTLLINDAREHNLRVEIIPGPSALTAAIAVCGLHCDRVLFLGFLPRSGPRRKAILERMATAPEAAVFFESPQRIKATLKALQTHCDDRRIALCRELTKLHEEVLRGTPADVLAILETRETIQGEITLVLEANPDLNLTPLANEKDKAALATEWLSAQPRPLPRTALLAKNLAAAIGLPRAEAYQWLLQHREIT